LEVNTIQEVLIKIPQAAKLPAWAS